MDPLPNDDLKSGLSALPSWTLAADGRSIGRDLEFKGFTAAFAFMTAVALEAQSLGHHPDWSNSWSSVSITLTTHSAGGVTALDLELAARIDGHAPATG